MGCPALTRNLKHQEMTFFDQETGVKKVDCVITTLEIEDMLNRETTDLSTLDNNLIDTIVSGGSTDILANSGSASGGYADHLFRYVAKTKYAEEIDTLSYKILKNSDFREVSLERDGKTVLKFAIANGFRNIQNLVQKLKRKRCDYDLVQMLNDWGLKADVEARNFIILTQYH